MVFELQSADETKRVFLLTHKLRKLVILGQKHQALTLALQNHQFLMCTLLLPQFLVWGLNFDPLAHNDAVLTQKKLALILN